MNEELLKKLEQRVNRRSFLKGSALAAAAIVGASATRIAYAQEPQNETKPKDDKSPDAKENDKDKGKDKDQAANASDDPTKQTKLDANGREFRECPQCGFNMYRQDRTWTCENCGYSYVE